MYLIINVLYKFAKAFEKFKLNCIKFWPVDERPRETN